MAAELALKASDFQSKVLDSSVPVLVDFWAEWCGPCKAIAPSVEQVAQEFAGKATVFKVNVDEESDLAFQYGILSIPTLLVFNGGQKVGQLIGATSKQKIAEFLQSHL